MFLLSLDDGRKNAHLADSKWAWAIGSDVVIWVLVLAEGAGTGGVT